MLHRISSKQATRWYYVCGCSLLLSSWMSDFFCRLAALQSWLPVGDPRAVAGDQLKGQAHLGMLRDTRQVVPRMRGDLWYQQRNWFEI